MKWQDDGWRPPEEKEEMLVALREEEHEEAHGAGKGLRKIQTKVVNMGNGNFVVIDAATMNRAAENAQRMGDMILQLGTMIGTMQRRMDEMEARQAAVTVRHADVKRIQARIRSRADELCGKYNLADRESPKKFRAAMKKDILRRWAVKDLHDLPDAALPAVEKVLDSWTDIRLIMERRVST